MIADQAARAHRVEIEVILQSSRASFSADDAEPVAKLLQEHRQSFDWGFFLDQVSRHKVFELVGRNLVHSGIAETRIDKVALVPVPHRRVMEAVYAANLDRNQVLLRELDAIAAALDTASVPYAYRKGGYLARFAYGDVGVRPMLDLDFLVQRADAGRATEVMESLGYRSGNIRRLGRAVEPWSEEARRTYLLSLPNLPSFVRPLALPNLTDVEVDFITWLFPRQSGFAIGTDEVLARTRRARVGDRLVSVLAAEDYLIDLCAHLYKEAKSFFYIELEKDLTLLKFLDIVEFLRSSDPDVDLGLFAERVATEGLGEPVFFALFLAEQLFPGTVPAWLLDRFALDDITVLKRFGEADRQPASWRHDLAERMFCSVRVWHAGGRSRLPRI